MLEVMEKYGPMNHLTEFRVRNLTMGSVLILLPFMPALRRLSMKYSAEAEENATNLTDELFGKIFRKTKFPVRKKVDDISFDNIRTRTKLKLRQS